MNFSTIPNYEHIKMHFLIQKCQQFLIAIYHIYCIASKDTFRLFIGGDFFNLGKLRFARFDYKFTIL